MDQSEQHAELRDSIRAVQRTAAALVTRLKPLATIRAGSADALGDLDKALEALGDTSTFVTALNETTSQGRELVHSGRARRADQLRLAMAGFLRVLESDRSVREIADGWRVGRVALELRPDEGRVRAVYNHEPLGPWSSVVETSDVVRIHASAEQLLDHAEIPVANLTSVILDAYASVAGRAASASSHHVRLVDVLEETRVVLVRQALAARRRKEAEAAISTPMWALLYNLDRFRAASAELPADQRLILEPGTVREGEKFGITLNGLDAMRDYQRFCYVRRVPAS